MSDSKATIQDVAEYAGVSITTVSRAINHPEKVKSRTLDVIYDAIRSTGYPYTNPAVRKNSRLILVVLPNIGNSFFDKVIEGIQNSAKRCGYHCLIYTPYSGIESEEELFSICDAYAPVGIIYAGHTIDEELLERLAESYPLVLCCRKSSRNLPFVSIDDFETSKMLTKHVISNNNKIIAFLTTNTDFAYTKSGRKDGYIAALQDANIEVNPKWIIRSYDKSYESVYSAVFQVFSQEEHPDALVASNDFLAIASINAIKDCGLQIPQDVSIAAFDNSFMSQVVDPPLTTINQPQFQLGSLSCEVLIKIIDSPSIAPPQITLNTELILRSST